MTRNRETRSRGVFPGVRGKREAHGAVFDGQWDEVIVGTEAWAKGRHRFLPHRGSPLWVAAFEQRPRLHVPRGDDDQNLRRDPKAQRLHQALRKAAPKRVRQPASRWGYEERCKAPQPSADQDDVHVSWSVHPDEERHLYVPRAARPRVETDV